MSEIREGPAGYKMKRYLKAGVATNPREVSVLSVTSQKVCACSGFLSSTAGYISQGSIFLWFGSPFASYRDCWVINSSEVINRVAVNCNWRKKVHYYT